MLCILVIHYTVSARVYKWVDEEGITHISDYPHPIEKDTKNNKSAEKKAEEHNSKDSEETAPEKIIPHVIKDTETVSTEKETKSIAPEKLPAEDKTVLQPVKKDVESTIDLKTEQPIKKPPPAPVVSKKPENSPSYIKWAIIAAIIIFAGLIVFLVYQLIFKKSKKEQWQILKEPEFITETKPSAITKKEISSVESSLKSKTDTIDFNKVGELEDTPLEESEKLGMRKNQLKDIDLELESINLPGTPQNIGSIEDTTDVIKTEDLTENSIKLQVFEEPEDKSLKKSKEFKIKKPQSEEINITLESDEKNNVPPEMPELTEEKKGDK